jgi:hypothetical protein
MTDDPSDRTPEELREEQVEKARDERRHAQDADTGETAAFHDRRSEKAAYLAARLAEQERSESSVKEEESKEP